MTNFWFLHQVEDLLATMKQAFECAFAENAKHHVVCELCPMHQMHKLCQEIDGKETYSFPHYLMFW